MRNTHRRIRTLLSAALAAALLVTLGVAAGGEMPEYRIQPRNADQPIRVAGPVQELGENSLTVDSQGSYGVVVVQRTEETAVLDAVTGQPADLSGVRVGDTVYAWAGPAMTRSLPPITNAQVLVVNVPQDMAAPSYSEVESVKRGEDGSVSLYVTGDMILHLGPDTELAGYRTRNVVGLDDLKPGSRIMAWYEMVMMSLPGQAVPQRVVVLPDRYEGYAEAQGLTVSVNGEDLALPGKVQEGRLMVPMRAFAESLGCQVGWEAGTNAVTVSQGERELYRFTIGEDQVHRGGDLVMALLAPAGAEAGVTYMAIEDLAQLHNVKLVDPFF